MLADVDVVYDNIFKTLIVLKKQFAGTSYTVQRRVELDETVKQ